MIDYNISTMTISLYVNKPVTINLINVAKYISIDEELIGLKFNYENEIIIRGCYQKITKFKKKAVTTKSFSNQISFVFNNNNHNVNVKLFINGSAHITGCKTSNESYDVYFKLINKLKSYSTSEHKKLIRDNNGVLLDNNMYIYTETKKQIMGIKSKSFYIINNKRYNTCHYENTIIYKGCNVLNLDGDEIGVIERKNKKNILNINKQNLLYINPDNNIIIDYIPEFIISENIGINDVNININCINFNFQINSTIDREKLLKSLEIKGYLCKFKPCNHPGINLKLKMLMINDNDYFDKENFGLCKCEKECFCTNVTIMIFESGKILCMGLKNEKYIDIIINETYNIINKYK